MFNKLKIKIMKRLFLLIGLSLLFFTANAQVTSIDGYVFFNDAGMNYPLANADISIYYTTSGGADYLSISTDTVGHYYAELDDIVDASIIATYYYIEDSIVKNIQISLNQNNFLEDVIFYDMTNAILFRGIVSSDAGVVYDAQVHIESDDGSYVGEATTNEEGYYEAYIGANCAKMLFWAVASYNESSQQLDGINAELGDTVELNFYLSDSTGGQGDAYVDFAWYNDINDFLTVYFYAFLDTLGVGNFGQVYFNWNFGDGVTQQTIVDSVGYVYANEGDYWVELAVTNINGDTIVSFGDSIFVYSYFPEDLMCFADFYYYPLDTNFMEYEFINYSYGVDDATTYFWDFGDGETSTDEFPVHLYQNPGEYWVTLYMDNGDCADTMSQLIWAGTDEVWFPDSCQALFYTYYLDSLLVEFDDIAYADGQIIERYWDFGDGTDAYTVAYPMHTYADTGVYTVSYSIVTDGGCMSTYTQDVFVYNNPDTSLLFFPTEGSGKAASVKVHGLGDDDDDWIWNFGDSKSSKGVVEHTYDNPGNYTITATHRYNGSRYGMDIRINDDWSMDIIKGYAYNSGSGSGVDEINIQSANIYPNPVTDKLNIVLENAQNSRVSISDASGRVVFEDEYNAQNISINVNDLQAGMYIVTIKTDDGLLTAKFIK